MSMTTNTITPRMISAFCAKRLAGLLDAPDLAALETHLLNLLSRRIRPALLEGSYDWIAVEDVTGIAASRLDGIARQLRPIFDAVARAAGATMNDLARPASTGGASESKVPRKKREYKKRTIEEFPQALWTEWEEPSSFVDALNLHIKRHGDSVRHLYRAVIAGDKASNLRTLMKWATGELVPRSVQSLAVLGRIERRYRLPSGYFKAKLPHPSRAPTGLVLDDFTPSERRRLSWHLPDDFNSRPRKEQEEILDWVNRVIITGSTDYRAYQAAAIRNKYAVRFRSVQGGSSRSRAEGCDAGGEVQSTVVDATPALEADLTSLLRFKTSTLTAMGQQRNGVWGTETASQKVEHLGLFFGAFVASPNSVVKGYGADLNSLCFAMLVFPSVWDWYLQWREERRGFYTAWEVDMLSVVLGMVRSGTGWLRQTPGLSKRLVPIEGLITAEEIATVQADWDAACEAMHKHGRNRIKEISRVSKVHRDPFEPILPILEADSPVGEYRKITDEIIRLMPDERRYPRAAAEAVRSFLLLRIGLHTGLRQKNLRQLRVGAKGSVPMSERALADLRCGELRWSTREHGWEVFIPSVAFKNASSSFFGKKPFNLILPDLAGLYSMIESYVDRHRAQLLGSATDPGTFFVKTVKQSSANGAYNQNTFYEAWRLTIQRYGIFNPYTGRGAIKGLLPHGPHNVRDVLATHILKRTGSYEQASYAIQDTPEMVAEHYGRFLPQDKAAIAAQVLNRVWDAA